MLIKWLWNVSAALSDANTPVKIFLELFFLMGRYIFIHETSWDFHCSHYFSHLVYQSGENSSHLFFMESYALKSLLHLLMCNRMVCEEMKKLSTKRNKIQSGNGPIKWINCFQKKYKQPINTWKKLINLLHHQKDENRKYFKISFHPCQKG